MLYNVYCMWMWNHNDGCLCVHARVCASVFHILWTPSFTELCANFRIKCSCIRCVSYNFSPLHFFYPLFSTHHHHSTLPLVFFIYYLYYSWSDGWTRNALLIENSSTLQLCMMCRCNLFSLFFILPSTSGVISNETKSIKVTPVLTPPPSFIP